MSALEVLFTSDLNEHKITCSAWDYNTGTNLMTYKGGGSANQRSLCFIPNEYVITANNTKPLIHVWAVNSQNQISSVRLVVPGKVSTLAITPDGNYLVAGIQETIYIWHVNSGRMFNTLSKHYQAVTCIRFTSEGSHFVSAGHDGGVIVWNLTQVVTRSDDNQTPLYSFSDHGLPVTDVYVGSGGLRAHMFTVSLDRSCKVYDLSSGEMLLNVVFLESLNCVVVNLVETCVYVGTTQGQIHQFHIESLPRTKEYNMPKEHNNTFIGHKSTVTTMALSLDGVTLLSGGYDNQVYVWNIPSKQLIRTLPHKGVVTNIALYLTSTAIFNPEYSPPKRFINNLKRMIDPPSADEDFVVEIFIGDQEADRVENFDLPSVIHESFEATDAGVSNQDEVERLRREIERLKIVNQQLFEIASKNVMHTKK